MHRGERRAQVIGSRRGEHKAAERETKPLRHDQQLNPMRLPSIVIRVPAHTHYSASACHYN